MKKGRCEAFCLRRWTPITNPRAVEPSDRRDDTHFTELRNPKRFGVFREERGRLEA
jgi:hypothetical protein